jgi:hypothetical protein
MLICLTCAHFVKKDTFNTRLYLGRCSKQDVQVMICQPDDGSGQCNDYKLGPGADERVKAYKEWKAGHPTPVYIIAPGTQVGTDERPKPVKKPKRRKR